MSQTLLAAFAGLGIGFVLGAIYFSCTRTALLIQKAYGGNNRTPMKIGANFYYILPEHEFVDLCGRPKP